MNEIKVKKIKTFFAIIISLFLVTLITNFSFLKSKIKNFSHHQKSKHKKEHSPNTIISKTKIRFISPSHTPEKTPVSSPTIKFSPSPSPSPTSFILYSPNYTIISPTNFYPSPTKKPEFSCPSFSNETYNSTSVIVKNQTPLSSRRDLTIPPITLISTTVSLVDGEIVDPDPKVPQFSTVFIPKKIPKFLAAYRVEGEIRGPQSTDIEILEIETNPGEELYFPQTGYDIGGGYAAMVLNADEDKITFKIGREDNVVGGYTLYFEGLCLDKNIETIYKKLNNEGRNHLPAIKIGQKFGFAKSNKLKIGLRDTGTFLDLRLVDKTTGESVWK